MVTTPVPGHHGRVKPYDRKPSRPSRGASIAIALVLALVLGGAAFGYVLLPVLRGRDVLAAAEYLKGRPDVSPGSIGAWGFSLGGLVSLQAAAQTRDIRAVVADGPFPVVDPLDMPAPESLSDWLWIPFDRVQLLAL